MKRQRMIGSGVDVGENAGVFAFEHVYPRCMGGQQGVCALVAAELGQVVEKFSAKPNRMAARPWCCGAAIGAPDWSRLQRCVWCRAG